MPDLTRKPAEKLLLGNHIGVTVAEADGGMPRHIPTLVRRFLILPRLAADQTSQAVPASRKKARQ
jgi:hypothetical protein